MTPFPGSGAVRERTCEPLRAADSGQTGQKPAEHDFCQAPGTKKDPPAARKVRENRFKIIHADAAPNMQRIPYVRTIQIPEFFPPARRNNFADTAGDESRYFHTHSAAQTSSSTLPAMQRALSEMVKQLLLSNSLGSMSAILSPLFTGYLSRISPRRRPVRDAGTGTLSSDASSG